MLCYKSNQSKTSHNLFYICIHLHCSSFVSFLHFEYETKWQVRYVCINIVQSVPFELLFWYVRKYTLMKKSKFLTFVLNFIYVEFALCVKRGLETLFCNQTFFAKLSIFPSLFLEYHRSHVFFEFFRNLYSKRRPSYFFAF